MHAVFLLPFPEAAAVVGWVAAALVLVGYGLMVGGRLAADSARYLTINAGGSAGLALSTVAAHAWQSASVNVLWLAFGLAPLHRALRRRRARLRAAAAAQAAVEVRRHQWLSSSGDMIRGWRHSSSFPALATAGGTSSRWPSGCARPDIAPTR